MNIDSLIDGLKLHALKKTGDLFESLDLVKETISDISSDLDNEGTEALKK